MARIFVYEGKEYPDPNPAITVDEVRQHLAGFMPELSNAETITTKRPLLASPGIDQDTVYEFKRKVGIKGVTAAPRKTSVRRSIKVTIGLEQAKRIYYNSVKPRDYHTLPEGLLKQIGTQVATAFPEIKEANLQLAKAQEIQERVMNSDEVQKMSDEHWTIRKVADYLQVEIDGTKIEHAYSSSWAVDKVLRDRIDAVVDAELDKAGVTYYRSAGQGFRRTDGTDIW
jgi:PRTRC genetic system protein C